MKIGGFLKFSLIDYPGKIAAVIFTQGCNFQCGYCHNPELIPFHSDAGTAWNEVLSFLKIRQGQLDGVTITGGEPLQQKEIFNALTQLRELGYFLKIDTNGSRPVVLSRLIEAGLVDYVAMDIKTDLKRYGELTRHDISHEVLETSIQHILTSGLPYEFRSTLIPGYHSAALIHQMAASIQGADRYFLQSLSNNPSSDMSYAQEGRFDSDTIDHFHEIAQQYVKRCDFRFPLRKEVNAHPITVSS